MEIIPGQLERPSTTEIAIRPAQTPEPLRPSPEALVDAYLEARAPLFALADKTWDELHKEEDALVRTSHELVQRFKTGMVVNTPTMNRQERRRAERQWGAFVKDPSAGLAMIAVAGRDMFKVHGRDLANDFYDIHDPSQLKDAFSAHVMEDRKEMLEAIDGRMPGIADPTDELSDFMMPYAQASLELAFLYEDGYFANNCITASIKWLLQEDPACIRPLIQKLKEDAAREPKDRLYSGLTEALAVSIADHPTNNILFNSLKVSYPDEKDIAPDFIRDLNGGTGNRRELLLAKSVMQSMVSIAKGFGVDEDQFLARYVDQIDSWPKELKESLRAYGAGRLSSEITDLKNLLRPFFDVSRSSNYVPRASVTITKEGNLATPSKRQRQREQRQGTDYIGRQRGATAVRGLVALETAEKEKPPIARIAVMRRLGDSSRVPRMQLEYAESFEDALRISNLQTCIEHYNGDPSVVQMVRGGLEHLLADPKDARYTRDGDGLGYLLEGDLRSNRRKARRFSPKHFPGVPRNSNGASLRLVYDKVDMEGVPTLLIYGVVPREDLKQYSFLPRRRWR